MHACGLMLSAVLLEIKEMIYLCSASSVDKAGGRRHTTYSSIDVYFHVVIAPTLLENPNKDSIVIEFDKNTRSGEEWNKKQFKLKLDRYESLSL